MNVKTLLFPLIILGLLAVVYFSSDELLDFADFLWRLSKAHNEGWQFVLSYYGSRLASAVMSRWF